MVVATSMIPVLFFSASDSCKSDTVAMHPYYMTFTGSGRGALPFLAPPFLSHWEAQDQSDQQHPLPCIHQELILLHCVTSETRMDENFITSGLFLDKPLLACTATNLSLLGSFGGQRRDRGSQTPDLSKKRTFHSPCYHKGCSSSLVIAVKLN